MNLPQNPQSLVDDSWARAILGTKRELEVYKQEFARLLYNVETIHKEKVEKLERDYKERLVEVELENTRMKQRLDEAQREMGQLKSDLANLREAKEKAGETIRKESQEIQTLEKLRKGEVEVNTEVISDFNGNILNLGQFKENKSEETLEKEQAIFEGNIKEENRILRRKFREMKCILLAQGKYQEEMEEWAKGKDMQTHIGLDVFKSSIASTLDEANNTIDVVSKRLYNLDQDRQLLIEKGKSDEEIIQRLQAELEALWRISHDFQTRILNELDMESKEDKKYNSRDGGQMIEKGFELILKRISMWRNKVGRQEEEDRKRIRELESNLSIERKNKLEEIEIINKKTRAYSDMIVKLRAIIIKMKKGLERKRVVSQRGGQKEAEIYYQTLQQKHEHFSTILESVNVILSQEGFTEN